MSVYLHNPLAAFCDTPLGGVVIADGRIAELVAPGGSPETGVTSTFDASGLVLLPGLINTHHHFYQTLTRAMRRAINQPLFPWLESLYPVWAGLTEPMVASATELALCELLLSGCTTTTDHHYVFNEALDNAIEVQADVAAQLGVRVVLTRGSMSLGQSAGGLPPDAVTQESSVILADSERLLRQLHDPAPHAMCQLALAPCSPFSVTADLMRDTAALAETHDVLLHTHLAETEDETEFCLATYGQRPLDLLASVDWLSPRAWFAHGIHFDADEIARLGENGCGVTHCPSSNMVLSSGICRARALEQAGVRVGLGVDGSASNDHSNLMQEVRQAFLLQRLHDGSVTHLDALRWATAGGADVLRRPELGRIEVGAAADLALFALDELRVSGAEDPLAALVFSGASRARHVMVAGQWRVRDYEIAGVDLADLQARHGELARALWSS